MVKYQYQSFTNRIKRILAIIRKELDWAIHDKVSMIILFLLPVLLLSIVGILATTKTNNTFERYTVYIIDNDQSEYSKAFIDFYKGRDWGYFNVYDSNTYSNVTLEIAQELIYTTALNAYLVIPDNFSEELLENRSATIELTIDGITPIAAVIIRTTFDYGNVQYQLKSQVFNGEILYFPVQRPSVTRKFLAQTAPMIIPMVLFACANMVASQSLIADEPLKRLLLTPTKEFDVIIAKTIAYSFLSSIVAFVSLFLLNVVFTVPILSFTDCFIICAMGGIFGVTFGILFSAIATSRLQAAQWFLFFYIVQVVLLMLLRIEGLVDLMPIEIVRAAFMDAGFRGIPLAKQWNNIIKMIGLNFGALFVAELIYKLKKQDV